jgi:Arc/MetJ-type ribon-helix-helix transcriptional regulator
MTDIITVRSDADTERALEILTRDGPSRSAAIRQAVLEAAARKERAEAMRRAVLRMPLGELDGVNVADEIAESRGEER